MPLCCDEADIFATHMCAFERLANVSAVSAPACFPGAFLSFFASGCWAKILADSVRPQEKHLRS